MEIKRLASFLPKVFEVGMDDTLRFCKMTFFIYSRAPAACQVVLFRVFHRVSFRSPQPLLSVAAAARAALFCARRSRNRSPAGLPGLSGESACGHVR